MVSCAACGRTKTKNCKDKQITFHRLPKKEEKLNFWIKFINKVDWVPSQSNFLCSLHFAKDCFDRSSTLKVRLKDNALPTIAISRLKYDRAYGKEESHVPTNLNKSGQNMFPIITLHTSQVIDVSKSSVPRPPSTPTKTTVKIEENDTPCKMHLKRKLRAVSNENILKSKKIRYLQKINWYQKRKIKSLTALISELKKKMC